MKCFYMSEGNAKLIMMATVAITAAFRMSVLSADYACVHCAQLVCKSDECRLCFTICDAVANFT